MAAAAATGPTGDRCSIARRPAAETAARPTAAGPGSGYGSRNDRPALYPARGALRLSAGHLRRGGHRAVAAADRDAPWRARHARTLAACGGMSAATVGGVLAAGPGHT